MFSRTYKCFSKFSVVIWKQPTKKTRFSPKPILLCLPHNKASKLNEYPSQTATSILGATAGTSNASRDTSISALDSSKVC